MDDPPRYLIALGSNMRHGRHGSPSRVLNAACEALIAAGVRVDAVSPIMESEPLGPSRRRYANAAAVVASSLSPGALLDCLQDTERAFGRRRRGARWRARVLDLDIVLWSGGEWRSDRLTIPHPEFRRRAFVLGPASHVAHDWRDPVTGRTVGQLSHRLARAQPRRA